MAYSNPYGSSLLLPFRVPKRACLEGEINPSPPNTRSCLLHVGYYSAGTAALAILYKHLRPFLKHESLFLLEHFPPNFKFPPFIWSTETGPNVNHVKGWKEIIFGPKPRMSPPWILTTIRNTSNVMYLSYVNKGQGQVKAQFSALYGFCPESQCNITSSGSYQKDLAPDLSHMPNVWEQISALLT